MKIFGGMGGRPWRERAPSFGEVALSLQTSLSHRELPPSAPAFAWQRFDSFCFERVLSGEVRSLDGRCKFFTWRGFAPDLWAIGVRRLCHTRVPRFRLPAPLRGSTPRQLLVYVFAVAPLCRSAQNDTEGVAFCKM